MGPLSANKEAVDGLVSQLLTTLTKGKSYGERWVLLTSGGCRVVFCNLRMGIICTSAHLVVWLTVHANKGMHHIIYGSAKG